MHRTFEVYLHHHGGHRRFVPLTCPRSDVLPRAQEMLDASDAVEAEVHELGEHLFTLRRTP